MPWRRAFDYSGRSTRREYWTFVATFCVGMFLYLFVLGLLSPLIGEEPDLVESAVITLTAGAYLLASILVGLSAAIRRLHDHDKSGWLILLAAIPMIGWLFFLFMMLTPGTDGPNSYGGNPRDPHADMNETAGIFA